jgi:transporter family protein
LLFQKGGPLSSVPVILAAGAAIMAVAGILFFREPASWQRLLGIALAVAGLFLLRK